MVYLLCLSNSPIVKEGDEIKFVYIDLKNDDNYVIDFTHERKVEYEKAIVEICEKIENAQLPEEIEHSKSCDFCEFKKICL